MVRSRWAARGLQGGTEFDAAAVFLRPYCPSPRVEPKADAVLGTLGSGGSFALQTGDGVVQLNGTYSSGALIGIQGNIEIGLSPPYPESVRVSGGWTATWVSP